MSMGKTMRRKTECEFFQQFFLGGDTLTCCFIEILPKCITILNMMTEMLCCINKYGTFLHDKQIVHVIRIRL